MAQQSRAPVVNAGPLPNLSALVSHRKDRLLYPAPTSPRHDRPDGGASQSCSCGIGPAGEQNRHTGTEHNAGSAGTQKIDHHLEKCIPRLNGRDQNNVSATSNGAADATRGGCRRVCEQPTAAGRSATCFRPSAPDCAPIRERNVT